MLKSDMIGNNILILTLSKNCNFAFLGLKRGTFTFIDTFGCYYNH